MHVTLNTVSVQARGKMETEIYRHCQIHYELYQPVGTKFWNARGRVEYYQEETLCSVNFTGTVNQFTSAGAAKQDFLSKAKNWIDRTLRNTAS